MADNVITVDNLSKLYRLDHQARRPDSFRELLTNAVAAPFRRLQNMRGRATDTTEEFWALNDVSFEVKRGEVVGIIGRNGAGKSTLLKVLSRIVEPTQGKVTMRGRVASLLEVGTGFHPELTGRENIYMNGSILGMKRHEIAARFDEIVEFSEVERFLDTPVKRYSSGMYVRLAFAVAAHLDPEILIVDEVLAVGDAAFQKKCLGKMKDVSASNTRTVLFVSHNTASIKSLCTSAIFLQHGTVAALGTTSDVLNKYLHSSQNTSITRTKSADGITLESVSLSTSDTGLTSSTVEFNSSCHLKVVLSSDKDISNAAVIIRIHNDIGELITSLCTPEEGVAPFQFRNAIDATFDIPRMTLLPGQYSISVFVYRSSDTRSYFEAERAAVFDVIAATVRDGMWPYQRQHGIVRLADGCKVSQL